MNFEAYSERLPTLHKFCSPKKIKRITQKRFQIINKSMKMKSLSKTQFAGLNDKRYYFHDRIVSLPFGYLLLEKVRKEKEKHRSKLHIEVKKNMCKFLELEGKGVHLYEKLRMLRTFFSQPPMLYEVNNSIIVTFAAPKNTRGLIINGSWK